MASAESAWYDTGFTGCTPPGTGSMVVGGFTVCGWVIGCVWVAAPPLSPRSGCTGLLMLGTVGA
ncbi:hypothetical protein [Nocardia wallacei]|uniref:hypothetical protein n=1 Tax=Nocardia wallacei TaxID=480035 RepID=UPI0024566064|nr:hypothetical protein [Nocardia wallacei]